MIKEFSADLVLSNTTLFHCGEKIGKGHQRVDPESFEGSTEVQTSAKVAALQLKYSGGKWKSGQMLRDFRR